jgi:hypothetical protein
MPVAILPPVRFLVSDQQLRTLQQCPLMAPSRLSDTLVTRSAFGLKADMPHEHVECPSRGTFIGVLSDALAWRLQLPFE